MASDKKTWFITGVSSGLGKALTEQVISNGDFVIGTVRKQEHIESFNRTYKKDAFAILLDVTDKNSVDSVLDLIKKRFGKIDVLVNNAGIGFAGAIEETDEQETRQLFEVNFFGVVAITKGFLPLFRKQKSGQIIQISSHGGIKASAGFGMYNASKFALEGYSEALAQEIGPLGIKLTIVEPGPFRTNFAGEGFGLAKINIHDYEATAGAFRERIKAVHGKQEGDPLKAAKAIIQIVNEDKPPLRLPLGKIALATIASKIESIQRDMDANRKIAEKAVF